MTSQATIHTKFVCAAMLALSLSQRTTRTSRRSASSINLHGYTRREVRRRGNRRNIRRCRRYRSRGSIWRRVRSRFGRGRGTRCCNLTSTLRLTLMLSQRLINRTHQAPTSRLRLRLRLRTRIRVRSLGIRVVRTRCRLQMLNDAEVGVRVRRVRLRPN